MITPMTLQDGLSNFIKTNIALKRKLKAANEDGAESFRFPQVRSGWILPNSIDGDDSSSEFPYIVTRITKVENAASARESIVTVKILFGVYDPGVYDENGLLIEDGSGYRDLWNLIEMTRRCLFEAGVIDNRYSIVEDYFTAEVLDEQVYPYWEGFCSTKWHIVYPQQMEKGGFYG